MQAAGSKPLNGYSFELKGAALVQKNACANTAHAYIENKSGVQAEGSTQAVPRGENEHRLA